ncbi:MAG: hypothetical protein JNM07_12555 [Phycisphaerae bacterium]|nr:hypothetical protein [Phycisphaerae bacterium]
MSPRFGRLVATLLLVVQVMVGVAPSGTVLCFSNGSCPVTDRAGDCSGPVASTLGGECYGESKQSRLPTPMPKERQCPSDCGSCTDLPIPNQRTRLETGSTSRDLDSALSTMARAAIVADLWLLEPPPSVVVHASDPPDPCIARVAVGIASTRLII